MPTKIDFRKSGTQIVSLPSAGESIIKFLGVCPISGVRLYECSTGNDPRGPLGVHASYDMEAAEYGMVGKTIKISWMVSNDRDSYAAALAYAKAKWAPKEG